MGKYFDLPPVWTIAHALAANGLSKFFPLVHFKNDTTDTIGVILIGLGLALALWSAAWFFKKKTPIEPRHIPKTLIVEGPYRINRNPIYTAMALVLLGYALWIGTLIAILAILLFPIIITKRFIAGEEDALKDAFGAEAEAYILKSRRW